MMRPNQCFTAEEARSSAAIYAQASRGRPSSTLLQVFLSHAHQDRTLATGVAGMLGSMGISVYIDWLDKAMPPSPNRVTAQKLKKKIEDCDLFLFLCTKNSKASRWCPWEIGYADGVMDIDRIVMVPFHEGNDLSGNEYLHLYRRLDPAKLRNEAKQKSKNIVSVLMSASNSKNISRDILLRATIRPLD